MQNFESSKPILLDVPFSEFEVLLKDLDLPKYKLKQIYKWLIKGAAFSEMSDLPKDLRIKLAEQYVDLPVRIEKEFVSEDGTIKFLYRLTDGQLIEGVLMRYKYGNTLCVSTQVGCRMGCSFCASTIGGLIRNLSAGEILGQVIAVNHRLGGDIDERKVTNLVLMGSGEPLDNYTEVVRFLRQANAEDGLHISFRNISLSTCGLIEGIKKLQREQLPINLTISLHSAIQSKRERLMPIAKANPLPDLKETLKSYFNQTRRRIYFEYTLVEGENDSHEDALKLSYFVKNLPSHVNLIRLNPVKESHCKASCNTQRFLKDLTSLGVSATVRRQMGVDIEGACGQLRRRYLEDQL